MVEALICGGKTVRYQSAREARWRCPPAAPQTGLRPSARPPTALQSRRGRRRRRRSRRGRWAVWGGHDDRFWVVGHWIGR